MSWNPDPQIWGHAGTIIRDIKVDVHSEPRKTTVLLSTDVEIVDCNTVRLRKK